MKVNRNPFHSSWLLGALLALSNCSSGPPAKASRPPPKADQAPPILSDAPLSPRQVHYEINAKYAPIEGRIDATMKMRWRNDGREPVTTLPFHLYMNAFKNERSLFWLESGGAHRGAEAKKDGWGQIELRRVALADADLAADKIEFPGPDETVVILALPAALAPGESIDVAFDFVVTLPEVFARTGKKGAFAMIAQWFPKIGVRFDDGSGERWHCEPFHLNSEFFADFGTYDVTLTVPDTHIVAATGVLVESRQDGATHVLRYKAEDVHDFAWMTDPYMEVISAPAETDRGVTEVRVYFRPAQRAFAERHLRAGVASITAFSRRAVTYPWPIMSIIDPPPDAQGSAGGMEYPTLVTTAGDNALTTGTVRLPEFVTIHEVGHNWFQGILASNEVDEAWLDEGVNEYIDNVIMVELYGESSLLDDWGFRADPFLIARAMLSPISDLADPIATRSYQFVDNNTYGSASYSKTKLALRTLENIVGPDRFAAAFKAWATKRAFTHPTGRQFFADLEDALGESIAWFTEPVFFGRGSVRLVVGNVECSETHAFRGLTSPVIGGGKRAAFDNPTTKWRCVVIVANTGTVPVPFDVKIELEDGTVTRHPIERGRVSARIEFDLDSPIVSVVADPDNTILLNEGGMASLWRRDSKAAPSARVASGFHGALQAVLSLGGL